MKYVEVISSQSGHDFQEMINYFLKTMHQEDKYDFVEIQFSGDSESYDALILYQDRYPHIGPR